MASSYTAADDAYIIAKAGKIPWSFIANKLKRNRHQVRGRWCVLVKGPPAIVKAEPDEQESIETIDTDGQQIIDSKSAGIKSVADLLKACKVDLTVWTVKGSKVKAYQSFFRNKQTPLAGGKSGWRRTAQKVQMYSVQVTLGRIPQAKQNNQLRNDLLADMLKRSPRPSPVTRPQLRATSSDRFMYELAPFDHHFGKLCWARETGENYDLRIATNRFDNVFDDLLSRVTTLPVEKILIVLGNDLFNSDNATNTTTGGTPQDTDGRWQKAFIDAKRAIVRNVEKCRSIAPVLIEIVPGNHDRERMFYMGEAIQSWFHNFNDVVVDNSPMLRKYIEYGRVGIGLTHGNEENLRELETLMRREAKDIIHRCDYFEWHTGHFHKKKETRFNAADTHGGIVHRVLPALTSTDAWHYMKGYVGNDPSSEAYLWHKSLGLWGHYNHSAEAWSEHMDPVAA